MRKILTILALFGFLAAAPAFSQGTAPATEEKPKCPCMLKKTASCGHKDCKCAKGECNCGKKSCGCPCCGSKEDKKV
jgi:hypothetical protein